MSTTAAPSLSPTEPADMDLSENERWVLAKSYLRRVSDGHGYHRRDDPSGGIQCGQPQASILGLLGADLCPNCGEASLVEEGCSTCMTCFHSEC